MQPGIDRALTVLERTFDRSMGVFEGKTIDSIPSGSPGFDRNTGVGGWPKGLISELSGEEYSGKTTLAFHACAQAQELGETAVYLDVENAILHQKDYIERIGVDTKKLVVPNLNTAEEYLNAIRILLKEKAAGLIVLDSVAALVPESEISGSEGAKTAELLSESLKWISMELKGSGCALLLLNQLRSAPSGRVDNQGQDHWELQSPCGRALRHYAILRARISKLDDIVRDGEILGSDNQVLIHKNKFNGQSLKSVMKIFPRTGMYTASEALRLGLQAGIIKLREGVLVCGDESLGHSRGEAAHYLHSHPDRLRKLYKELVALPLSIPAVEP